MLQELSWICGIAPTDFKEKIEGLCKELNTDIGLPETVFRFPLHISMKKSFQTADFEKVRQNLIELVKSHGSVKCRIANVVLHKNMIWLSIEKSEDIMKLHRDIDALLLTKYNIPTDKFDINFKPHISLFTKGAKDDIQNMYGRLKKLIKPTEIKINRFVVGSSRHKDIYFNTED